MLAESSWGQAATAAASEASIDGLELLDFRKVIADSTEQVFPSVVYIKCRRESHESGERSNQDVSGSGVIISKDGDILTNWHVVDKAVEVRCLLYDGRPFEAEVIGTDKDLDLALIRLKTKPADLPLPHAAIGDSTDLSEGDFVMAMGAPWGMNRSVSIGIISCTRRYLPDNSEYSLWLQTDAAISPGNSGGPLVDTTGKVVGINTRGIMYGGDMGFAIPAETVKVVLPQLRKSRKIAWSWTGLQLQALRNFDRNIYFEGEEGVIVAGTDEGSPARHAGLQPRDRILTIDDRPVNALTEEDLPAARRQFGLLPVNQEVTLSVLRDGEAIQVPLTPRQKGDVEGKEIDLPRWDMTVKAINRFDNPDLHFHREQGVFIFGTRYPGNASNAGLTEKDIILKIDGEKIESIDDIKQVHKQLIDNIDDKHRVLVAVLRDGLLRQVVLDFKRDYKRD